MAASTRAGFLAPPVSTAAADQMFASDLEQSGFVMNASRLWDHQAETHDALFELLAATARAGSLTIRQRGILVTACASTLGDSYCSLARGTKLSDVSDPNFAAAVLLGSDEGLDPAEAALARWARTITRDPNATVPADVEALRTAGFDDTAIFAITVFVALRIAFSTVNDALGACPDVELGNNAPAAVVDAVAFGRPIGVAPD